MVDYQYKERMENTQIDEIKSIGVDLGKGNILGIQPFLSPGDYVSEDTFMSAIDSYLSFAKAKGLIHNNTIVIFPEYIGTWLLFTGEQAGFIQAHTVHDLVNLLRVAHPNDFSKYSALSREKDTFLAAVFRMKSNFIAEIYQKTFSHVALKYGVAIIAGSVNLSNPKVENGTLLSQSGPIYNVSAVFRSDGTIYPYVVKKIYPVPAEIGFITPGTLEELSIFTVMKRKLGVLICGDSWYTAPYKKLKDKHVDSIVVPSFQNEKGLWDKPWKGYPELATETYDTSDIGKISEGMAWEKYALLGKINSAQANIGLNVFLKGNLWDMDADSGHSIAIKGSEHIELSTSKAGLINVWLS
jgi:predicted amidohydrolase